MGAQPEQSESDDKPTRRFRASDVGYSFKAIAKTYRAMKHIAPGGEFYASANKTLPKRTGLSARTITSVMLWLRRDGNIEVLKAEIGRPTRYRLVSAPVKNSLDYLRKFAEGIPQQTPAEICGAVCVPPPPQIC